MVATLVAKALKDHIAGAPLQIMVAPTAMHQQKYPAGKGSQAKGPPRAKARFVERCNV